MPLGTESRQTDFTIFIQIEDRIFSQTEFMSLNVDIAMNSAPRGEVIMLDRNGLGISTSDSGKLMLIEFDNVSDEKSAKHSSLMCVIDSIEEETSNSENNIYKIKFSAGTPEMLTRKTSAYTGTSAGVLEDVYAKFNVANSNSMKFVALNTSIKFADTMTWRCASETFWGQMEWITRFSYRENDYLFWSWDDVNDAISVSTLQNSSQMTDRYVFIQSDNAIAASDVVKRVSENPDYTVWSIGEIRRKNDIGAMKDKLFPNTSLGTTNGTKQVTGEIRNECFTDTMSSMGNTAVDDIKHNTDLAKGSTYAPVRVVRQNPNNTHNMYGVAEDVRNYVMSTYAKKLKVVMHNNAGPSVGSKVLVICINNNAKSGSSEIIDKMFSDNYVVARKYITYTSVGTNNVGEIVPETPRQRTVFELVSSNFAGDGTDAIKKAAKEFKWA